MPHSTQLPLLASIAALLACSLANPLASVAQTAPQPAPGHGLDLSLMDRSVMPCRDLYDYANGAWSKSAVIPPDRSSYGVNTDIDERNLAIEKAVASAAASDTSAAEPSPAAKVGAFYQAGMDIAVINAAGATDLAPEMARIAAIKDQQSLTDEFARFNRLGLAVPFAFGSEQDAKNSAEMIAGLYQSGLGLPDREYYLDSDAASVAVRAKYQAHVARMIALLGDSPDSASREAAQVVALETSIARISLSRLAQRDPTAVYHRMTAVQLAAIAPQFDWTRYFADLQVPTAAYQAINVAMPSYTKAATALIGSTPIPVWQTYLRWHLIDGTASYLSDDFVNENFAFNGKVLSGTSELEPRWKRVLSVIDGEIGEDLGQLYVAKAFSPEAKQRALTMVLNLKATLRDDISHLAWMGPSTRAEALAKCDAMMIKVGYPDHWRDYSALHLTSTSYVTDVLRGNEFEFQREADKIGKPVDRTEWGMTPPTNNAYYDPSMNEIVFPAGILQPPFFSETADDAVNYGEIGATIGHEMTHGFDDEGRQYDAQGNLKNWWTPQDLANFKSRAGTIVSEYNGFLEVDNLHVNGALTLGENIADNGGTKIAYIALERALAGKPQPLLDGFTPAQRYFIAYAQSWRTSNRPEVLRRRLITDPHSPEIYRVNGVVSNMAEFYQAFHCPVPASAYKATIW